MAVRSARALMALEVAGIRSQELVTDQALHNAMVVHAAFGGSTNLILHVPAIAHAAGRKRPRGGGLGPDQSRGAALGRCAAQRPRVSTLPCAPFLAGGVPEVMLHLRRLGAVGRRG